MGKIKNTVDSYLFEASRGLKTTRILKQFGIKGGWLWHCILQQLCLHENYYILTDDETLQDLADYAMVEKEFVSEFMEYVTSRYDDFNPILWNEYRIIRNDKLIKQIAESLRRENKPLSVEELIKTYVNRKRTKQNGIEENRTEENLTEEKRIELKGKEENLTERNRTERNRTERNRTEQNRTEEMFSELKLTKHDVASCNMMLHDVAVNEKDGSNPIKEFVFQDENIYKSYIPNSEELVFFDIEDETRFKKIYFNTLPQYQQINGKDTYPTKKEVQSIYQLLHQKLNKL